MSARTKAKSPADAKADEPVPATAPEATAPEPTGVDAWAEKELAAMTPAEAPEGVSESEIAEKVSVGLTRDQAIEIILRQRAEDASREQK